MKVKKVIADFIAKSVLKSAKVACGAASYYGICQPKEPVDLKARIKKHIR